MAIDRYLPLADAAKKYNYTNSATLRQAILRGSLKAERIGNMWVTTDEWMQEFIQNRPSWNQDERLKLAGGM